MRRKLIKNRQVAPLKKSFLDYLINLLECDEKTLKKFMKDNLKFIVKKSKEIEECSSNEGVVIKSIRLTAEHVQKLLFIKNLKIIHLVR